MKTTSVLKGSRLGGVVTRHSARFKFGEATSGADVLIATLKADTFNPIAYRLYSVNQTAFDSATTAVLRAGVAAGGTTLLNDIDAKATAGTNNVNALGAVQVAYADIAIYGRLTLTGATTAGEVWLILEVSELNTKTPTSAGD